MIRTALIVIIPALLLQLTVRSLVGLVLNPRVLIQLSTLEVVPALCPSITLILFLFALYQEVSGRKSAPQRQTFALVAALGMVIGLGLTFWHLHQSVLILNSLTPQMRSQQVARDITAQWVRAIVWSVPPFIGWIMFLLIFWYYAAPLGRALTRNMAGLMCVFGGVLAIVSTSQLIMGLQRRTPGWVDWGWHPFQTFWGFVISPAVEVIAGVAVPYFFFSVWRTVTVDPSKRSAIP